MAKLPGYKKIFAISDFIIILICYTLSAYLSRLDENSSFTDYFLEIYDVFLYTLFLVLVHLFVLHCNYAYRVNVITSRSAHLVAIIKSYYFGFIGFFIVAYNLKQADYSDGRLMFIWYLLLFTFSMYFFRAEFLRYFYLKYNNLFKTNTVIVGDEVNGKLLATKLIVENTPSLNILGFITDNGLYDEQKVKDSRYLGKIDHLSEIYQNKQFDEIIISTAEKSHERVLELFDMCNKLGVNVKLTSQLFSVITEKIPVEHYADVAIIGVTPRYNHRISLFYKRVFDFSFSLFVLSILIPAFILLYISIKLTSPGPAIFRQVRIGKGGKRFVFYKFRTMFIHNDDKEREKNMLEFMNEEKNSDGKKKIIDERNLTSIGRLLRRASLDELPQLFNVLKGDMSIVGPRPCLPYEYENFKSWQKRRTEVVPGCTGVWQVWGRGSVSFIDSVIMDIYYINNRSPWLDLQIIFKTIPIILFGRGGK